MSDDIFSQIDPETLLQLLRLGEVEPKQALVADRLAQARALRDSPVPRAITPTGAMWGGLRGIMNGLVGGFQDARGQKQQDALIQQQTAGRDAFLQALIKQLRGGGSAVEQQAPAAPRMLGDDEMLPGSGVYR